MTMKINDNGTDRDMTKDEETAHLANAKIATAEAKIVADALEARQAARQAVLDKLGLTADEANALLG
jgi:hypothetical protein